MLSYKSMLIAIPAGLIILLSNAYGAEGVFGTGNAVIQIIPDFMINGLVWAFKGFLALIPLLLFIFLFGGIISVYESIEKLKIALNSAHSDIKIIKAAFIAPDFSEGKVEVNKSTNKTN